MTIHAYSELYLNDAINNLANAFDYAINVCNLEPNLFAKLFVNSNFSTQFECGNPTIISGKSGVELVRDILNNIYPNKNLPEPVFSDERSKEYWAGWAIAQYQWYTAKRFKNIFERISLSEIISMYTVFHEMDISRFFESMDEKYNERIMDTKLHRIRESRHLSQSQLSKLSSVNLRSIQLYEQKVNDIDKAQGQTLYKLSHALGCSIEDLLENPESI